MMGGDWYIIIISSIIYLTENKLTSLRLRSTDGLSFVLCSKVKIVKKIEICVTHSSEHSKKLG